MKALFCAAGLTFDLLQQTTVTDYVTDSLFTAFYIRCCCTHIFATTLSALYFHLQHVKEKYLFCVTRDKIACLLFYWNDIVFSWIGARCKHAHCATSKPHVSAQTNTPPVTHRHSCYACLLISVTTLPAFSQADLCDDWFPAR